MWLKCDYIFLFGFSMKGQHREVPCGTPSRSLVKSLRSFRVSQCARTHTEGILDVHWHTLSLWSSSTMENRDICRLGSSLPMIRPTRRVPLSGMWSDSGCGVWRGRFDIFRRCHRRVSQRRSLSTGLCCWGSLSRSVQQQRHTCLFVDVCWCLLVERRPFDRLFT